MANHHALNHTWPYDDKGGERTLPFGPECCVHCGQTYSAFDRNPQKCAPRPNFTPKADRPADAA